MKIITFSLLLTIIVTVLAGCSNTPPITSGTIIYKEFIPAHTSRTIIMIPRRVGNITTTYPQPVTHHYPDQWMITFENMNEEDIMVQRTVSVSEQEYNSCEIGDYFFYNPED